ncbi:hypothetical protein BDV95DRAFT_570262 [Massariosphaeria phaeospora]|uniref:RlpA-like double-psi beta-barrel-protein domain-containing protein-containing protein n=1 Tax=Massariosphaeria phaeospora TaxID=100035 RepID=A0A7C8MBR0_9PLEO|nr:hypothetical protein BDV95DRAFT_570262 [Massariosphaeria phaeospora]
MKTSAILASALFGALAIAAPVDRRALVTQTEIVVETVVVYTTIWDDEPAAQATPTPAAQFHEKPVAQAPAHSEVKPTPVASVNTAPANTPAANVPAVVEEPSKAYTPPAVQTPFPEPTPTPTPSPKPVEPQPMVEQPAAPSVISSAAPVQSSAPPSSGPEKKTYDSTDLSMHVYGPSPGSPSACGPMVTETEYKVAITADLWGASTWDIQSGASTNRWCNMPITIEHNGKTVDATIIDLCNGGCGSNGLDVSRAVWQDLVGPVGSDGSGASRLSMKWWPKEY